MMKLPAFTQYGRALTSHREREVVAVRLIVLGGAEISRNYLEKIPVKSSNYRCLIGWKCRSSFSFFFFFFSISCSFEKPPSRDDKRKYEQFQEFVAKRVRLWLSLCPFQLGFFFFKSVPFLWASSTNHGSLACSHIPGQLASGSTSPAVFRQRLPARTSRSPCKTSMELLIQFFLEWGKYKPQIFRPYWKNNIWNQTAAVHII